MCRPVTHANKTAIDGARAGPAAFMQQEAQFRTRLACLVVLGAIIGAQPSVAGPSGNGAPATAMPHLRRADFAHEHASPEVRHIADWVLDSMNNGGLPFAIVDKIDAKVFVFSAGGTLRGAAPALLGSALGDDSVPGIGDKKLANILPGERTTPAGRFAVEMGRNMRGEEILWVDYDAAVSLHRVITSNPKEHRAQRLATPTPLDNRITYGCINVAEAFYLNVVHPVFSKSPGIVYVLPETRSIQEVFNSYRIEETCSPCMLSRK